MAATKSLILFTYFTLSFSQAIDFDTTDYPNITEWLKNCESLPGYAENEKGVKMFGNDIRRFAPEEFK